MGIKKHISQRHGSRVSTVKQHDTVVTRLSDQNRPRLNFKSSCESLTMSNAQKKKMPMRSVSRYRRYLYINRTENASPVFVLCMSSLPFRSIDSVDNPSLAHHHENAKSIETP